MYLDNPKYGLFSKEFSSLDQVSSNIRLFFSTEEELLGLRELSQDMSLEAEIRTIANDELSELKQKTKYLEDKIKFDLLPKDDSDDKDVILEVRAGSGGDEASLFVTDLLRMYQRYSENNSWKTETVSMSSNGIGGLKEVIISIHGSNVYSKLKFESGVHRVQRVPETESSGRVHTSAATVAVLAEIDEVDFHIDDKDLRIDVFRASGPGGQSVNTTDSAVRITHLPTGIVLQQQDEKSQHKNKAKAMKILRSRIYDLKKSEMDAERAKNRKDQIGRGDRSERIRTYNFPQGRVTDHRINITFYNLDQILNGCYLGKIIDSLILDDRTKKLSCLDNE
jgi:peptide chain release factor 1